MNETTKNHAGNGYESAFLSDASTQEITLPQINSELCIQMTRDSNDVANHCRFSLVMSKTNKMPFYIAANFDGAAEYSCNKRKYEEDPNYKSDQQIGEGSYAHDEGTWEKGHIMANSHINWFYGPNVKKIPDDSCILTNLAFHHKNYHRGSYSLWRTVEALVYNSRQGQAAFPAKDNRFSIFAGPLFTDIDRWYSKLADNNDSSYREQLIRIPSAFWKIIAFIEIVNDQPELKVYAFIFFQNRVTTKMVHEQLQQHAGQPARETLPINMPISIWSYRTSTTLIEDITGINFCKKLKEHNAFKKGELLPILDTNESSKLLEYISVSNSNELRENNYTDFLANVGFESFGSISSS